jgi:hypothetical protein
MSFAAIAQDYIANIRPHARDEMRFYARQPSLREAIREAALCRVEDGKRHPHQRRIPGHVLAKAERALQERAERLAKADSFDALHTEVCAGIGNIRGIGDLAVYDIAHRIGAYLKLEPDLVYLHAGTRAGAKALGLSGEKLARGQLPADLQRLKASELEDCLCIYRSMLRGAAAAGKACFSQSHCA